MKHTKFKQSFLRKKAPDLSQKMYNVSYSGYFLQYYPLYF